MCFIFASVVIILANLYLTSVKNKVEYACNKLTSHAVSWYIKHKLPLVEDVQIMRKKDGKWSDVIHVKKGEIVNERSFEPSIFKVNDLLSKGKPIIDILLKSKGDVSKIDLKDVISLFETSPAVDTLLNLSKDPLTPKNIIGMFSNLNESNVESNVGETNTENINTETDPFVHVDPSVGTSTPSVGKSTPFDAILTSFIAAATPVPTNTPINSNVNSPISNSSSKSDVNILDLFNGLVSEICKEPLIEENVSEENVSEEKVPELKVPELALD